MFAIPLMLWKAYAWFGTGSAIIGPILKKVPWQIWVGIAAVIAVLWYGHVREKRGYARCQQQVKIATDHELARQNQVTQNALKDALDRARVAAQREQEANRNADKLQEEVDKLKEAGQKCLPKSITDRYRR